MLKNCHSLDKWLEMCPSISNLGLGTRVKDHGGDEVLTEEGWYATYQFILEVIFHHRMETYECLTNDSTSASAIFVPFYAGFDVGRYLWGYNATTRDALGVELVQWLRNQPEWNNNGMWGRDHFFVSGRIAWDLRRDDVSQWGSKLMMLPESMNMTLLTVETTSWSNEFAVPYPSYFHPTNVNQVHQWQERIRTHERRYLYAFVGAPRANMTVKKCKLLNCQQRERCENPVEVMRVFQDSVFCLQPPGDSPTRRSIFDSILAGCIPVFFHPFSAYGQYLCTEEEIVGMRKVVIGLIPKVIYGDPRSKSMGYEDAFGIAIKGVLERIGNVRRRIEEGNDLGTGLAEPDGWKLKLDGIGRDHDWDKFF
ncbi:Probable xyloglucan galactosyltransferase GT12 [Linum perenne]